MPDTNPMLSNILHSLDELQATDIKVIDVKAQTTVTDYMIVASGRASRHVRAIAIKLMEDIKKAGLAPMHYTGVEQGDWALIDFGDFVVHIMQPDSRNFYNLEELWEERK